MSQIATIEHSELFRLLSGCFCLSCETRICDEGHFYCKVCEAAFVEEEQTVHLEPEKKGEGA